MNLIINRACYILAVLITTSSLGWAKNENSSNSSNGSSNSSSGSSNSSSGSSNSSSGTSNSTVPATLQYIYTPTLQKDDDKEKFTCRIVNIGKSADYFDIAILSSTGTLLETQKSVLLEPGATSSDTTKSKNTIAYCRVGVRGSTKDVIATLCSQDKESTSCKAVVSGQWSPSN